MSEGEGVERDGGERDNTTFAAAERHVSDGVPYSRFFSPLFFFLLGALNLSSRRVLAIGLWGLKLSSR